MFTKEKRSWVMAQVKSGDTGPEIRVRSMLHGLGFRFRLHRKDLPGKPDIVFPGRRKVVFVHGCFWHGHKGCRRSTRPSSNQGFWTMRLDSNIRRDKRDRQRLRRLGWRVFVVWECELKDEQRLRRRLRQFLEGSAD